MSEVQTEKKQAGLLKTAITGLILIGVVGVLYVIGSAAFKSQSGSLKAFQTASLEKLMIATPANPLPDIRFKTGDGREVTLQDFKGKVVVLNLWATWCPPCRVEMPSLAKLQAAYADKPVEVIALSVDKAAELDSVQRFMAENAPLKVYLDPGYKMAFGLEPRVEGFPTTLIINQSGKEVARLPGEADWMSPEARGMIDHLLANP